MTAPLDVPSTISFTRPRRGCPLKKIDVSAQTGDGGIALIHQQVNKMGFVWHERKTDARIDGEIELRNPVTGEVANRFILIQSKTSNRRFSGENDRSFHFICEPADVTYRMGAEEPVLLVCSHPEAGQAWRMHVRAGSATRLTGPRAGSTPTRAPSGSTPMPRTKPANEASLPPVLMIDASGFAASGQSRAGTRPSDAVPTWDEVRTLIQRAWAMFSSDDSGLPDNAGGTADASIGSDIGSVAAPVPVVDLLGEDVDITPARHLPSDSVARVSLDLLTRHRSSLQTLLAELPHLLPDLPPDRPPGAAPRGSSLEELAQSGMLYIRRTAPRAVIEESSLPKVRRTIITGRDLVRAVPPTEEDDVPDDEVLRPRVREGDVLVPHVARQLIARVAQGQDVGAVLSSSVVLIRPDSVVLDPWYLAGLLSSSDSGRQATRMASTLGDTVRFDPRRVRIPVLPIEDQRTHGAAFRRLADLARTLRAAHDEGNALIHDLIEATVSSISAAPELQR